MTFAAFTAALIATIDSDRMTATDDGDRILLGRRLSRGRWQPCGSIEPVDSDAAVESLDDLIISATRQLGYVRSVCAGAL